MLFFRSLSFHQTIAMFLLLHLATTAFNSHSSVVAFHQRLSKLTLRFCHSCLAANDCIRMYGVLCRRSSFSRVDSPPINDILISPRTLIGFSLSDSSRDWPDARLHAKPANAFD